MSRRQTPTARALVGVLALRDGATTSQAFKLAGYELINNGSGANSVRVIRRNGRRVAKTRAAYLASEWLFRLGRKIESLAGKAAT
jgi:hypothetical protein